MHKVHCTGDYAKASPYVPGRIGITIGPMEHSWIEALAIAMGLAAFCRLLIIGGGQAG